MSSWVKFCVVVGLIVPYAAFVMADNRTESRSAALKLVLVWFGKVALVVALLLGAALYGALANPSPY